MLSNDLIQESTILRRVASRGCRYFKKSMRFHLFGGELKYFELFLWAALLLVEEGREEGEEWGWMGMGMGMGRGRGNKQVCLDDIILIGDGGGCLA